MTDRWLYFGDYRLDVAGFELHHMDSPVAMEPQVFALLAYLVTHRDRLISKNELLDELWGHRFVSESALSTQIKTLRRTVGDDGRNQRVIKTVHGRGYRFIADVTAPEDSTRHLSTHADLHAGRPASLPRERTRLFGREQDILHCQAALEKHRLVSVLGIGGTGKTRLAMAVGHATAAQFSDGVVFVDLVPAASRSDIESSVANSLGLALATNDSLHELANALQQQNLLLILDNCEHVRDDVAHVVDYFLEYTTRPNYLITSRDPLDLGDERRFYLDPLQTRRSAAKSPAEELFLATAERHGVNVTDKLASPLAQKICQQLDGLPLAKELAAAQLRYLTLEELSTRMDQRLHVLDPGSVTAKSRQSNLTVVLEDTWALLNEQEQQLLGQLAIFPSQFTMTDVEELLGTESAPTLPRLISRLVELCLLSRGADAWWRTLETVREFALSHMSTDARLHAQDNHAAWCQAQLGDYPHDHLDNLSQANWCLEHYADLQAAEFHLDEQGRTTDAMLICCATGLMIQLDDGARARGKLQRALFYLARDPDPYWTARLHATAGLCAQGNRSPEQLAEHTATSLHVARELDDPLLIASGLIMQSLTTVFTDGELALAQTDEVIRLGERGRSVSTVNSGRCFRAWHLGVLRQYDDAMQVALDITNDPRLNSLPSVDNPVYNAVGTLVTCTVLNQPLEAARWAQRFATFPAVASFWVIQLLRACVHAANAEPAQAADLCLVVKGKLNRAGRDEFPDVAVPAAVMACRAGDEPMARRWLKAIKDSRRTIQTYHMIMIYRQLYDQIGFADEAMAVDTTRAEIGQWLVDQSDSPQISVSR